MKSTAQMPDDTGHRVQRGLHRAFDPGRCPADAITRHENAAFVWRQVVLHEVAEHSVIVAIMPGKGTLESTEKVGIVLPADRDRVAEDM